MDNEFEDYSIDNLIDDEHAKISMEIITNREQYIRNLVGKSFQFRDDNGLINKVVWTVIGLNKKMFELIAIMATDVKDEGWTMIDSDEDEIIVEYPNTSYKYQDAFTLGYIINGFKEEGICLDNNEDTDKVP